MNNTEPTAEENASQATIEELVDRAHEHYLEAFSKIHHWNSLIPKALDFYKKWHQAEHNLQGLKEESWQIGYRQGLQSIAEEVEQRLKDYDIIDYMDKGQVYDALDASNPQEVGEIKQLVWFYHLITKHLDQ